MQKYPPNYEDEVMLGNRTGYKAISVVLKILIVGALSLYPCSALSMVVGVAVIEIFWGGGEIGQSLVEVVIGTSLL